MDPAPCFAVSRALLSADLCPRYARALGISFFLLVPVCLGHSCLGFTGVCLLQNQNLNTARLAGRAYTMLPAATGRGEQRIRSIPAALLMVGFVEQLLLRISEDYWPFGGVEAV